MIQNIKIRTIDLVLNRFREKKVNLSEEVLFDFYERILKYKPVYIKGYPTMVYQFAKFLKEKNIDGRAFKLKMVECTAETVLDIHKELVEDVFGCKMVNQYGSAETGIISFECPEGGNHISADCIYEEFIDIPGKYFDSNAKELVVTDLNNYSLPMIRYKIDDIVIPETRNCSCGRGLPLLNKIEGRTCDFILGSNNIRYHDSILTYTLREIFDKNGGIKQFKVFQNEINKLEFHIMKDQNFDKTTTNYITKKLRDIIGDDLQINYKFVTNIEREKSGKLRYFVSMINQ